MDFVQMRGKASNLRGSWFSTPPVCFTILLGLRPGQRLRDSWSGRRPSAALPVLKSSERSETQDHAQAASPAALLFAGWRPYWQCRIIFFLHFRPVSVSCAAAVPIRQR